VTLPERWRGGRVEYLAVAAENLLELYRLARDCGIQTAYWDLSGRRVRAGPDQLLAALKAFGLPIDNPARAGELLRERRARRWAQVLEPVCVAWDGRLDFRVRVPASRREGRIRVMVSLEGGSRWEFAVGLAGAPVLGRSPDGQRLSLGLRLPASLPPGYHRLRVEAGPSLAGEALVVSAPIRAAPVPGRAWGVFLPLYALQTDRSWGIGDFTDLKVFAAWATDLGAAAIGILPVLAAFLDRPFEPSPYAPATRLFWNDLYVDPTSAPNFPECEAARQLVAGPEFRAVLERLRGDSLVDYAAAYAVKRRVLGLLAADFFRRYPDHPDLASFRAERPEAEDYARFRAAVERFGTGWPAWPEPFRSGLVGPGEFDDAVWRYHIFVQWLADRQLAAVPNLYLDLPLGVHPDGYDVWRHREVFALGVRAGAPPDMFFTAGQDWGFPPLHPERLREAGYGYFIAALRHHMRRARMLRVDHVMGLHRLYWLPPGHDARSGVYVRYPADELYAILTLESVRSGCAVVGENLGTVPPEVNPTLAQHGMLGMYVLQFELRPEGRPRPPEPNSVASLNTHDTPTFAGFWAGREITDRVDLGLLDEAGAAAEREYRSRVRAATVNFLQEVGLLPPDEGRPEAVLRGLLKFLGRSEAAMVLVNLEDLWLENRPQNVPGTSWQRPNWRRKARYAFEEFSRSAQVAQVLGELSRDRGPV